MKTAAEVMNRNFFYASHSDSVGALLDRMGELGLGSAPVLDLEGRPLGTASVGEIRSCYDLEEVTERLRRPAVCVHQNTPLDVAARTLALHESDDLLLLDDSGAAVGLLSAHDLLRAVLGLNATQQVTAPFNRELGWEEADYLDLGAAHRAPEAPGIILLSPGLDASTKRIVWAESVTNMRERLDEMLRNPQQSARLEAMLDVYPRSLRFRCLTVYDAEQRERVASALCNVEEDEPPRRQERQELTACR